ncbi:MAG TPA: fatty acid desaturase family protein [Myxococcales bacterium]|nr:fatty acid desaturase family protein [Myxococcales bacterium]
MTTAVQGHEFRIRAARPLPGGTLRTLTRLSPVRSTLSLLQTFGLTAAALALAVRFPQPLVIAAAIVFLAGQQHALAILAHQSAHYRLYETRWLNDLCGKLCGIPLGVSMVTYRVIHRIHHNNLYSPIDPDLPLMAGYPRGRAYLALKLAKDLLGATTLKNYAYFFGVRRAATGGKGRLPREGTATVLDDTAPALREAARRDRVLVVAANLALFGALIATGAFGWYLLLWVLPLATLLQVLLRLRAVLEHGAVPDTADALRAARTTLAPWWVRWLVYPHNMNYHVEHHLYPAIPHYRLPQAHRALAEAGLLELAEISPGLGESLRRIARPAAS